MQCLILAGGKASRLRPLTDTIPKALIPVGSHPFLYYQLHWLAQHGVDQVVLSIGYRGEMIRKYVENNLNWGLSIKFVDEGNNLRGTAGAVRFAADSGALNDAFLLTYGDSFLPIDHQSVWDEFLRCSKPALMTVYKNEGRWDKSNVCYQNGQVTHYDKFSRGAEPLPMNYIDYGLSAFKRDLIEQRFSKDHHGDLADMFRDLSHSNLLAGIEAQHRFFEIGSFAGLAEFKKWVKVNWSQR